MYLAPCSSRMARAPKPRTRPRESASGKVIRSRKRSSTLPLRARCARPAACSSSALKPSRRAPTSTRSHALGA